MHMMPLDEVKGEWRAVQDVIRQYWRNLTRVIVMRVSHKERGKQAKIIFWRELVLVEENIGYTMYV